MKKEVNSKKNSRTEPVTYRGRQVCYAAQLVKILKVKREKILHDIKERETAIGGTKATNEAHIAEVQGPKASNVRGTKASKSLLVGVQGTDTKQTKQLENIGGAKATSNEVQGQSRKPNNSSLNVVGSKIPIVEGPKKMQTKRTFPSFSLASYSLEKKSKLSTNDESRTKVSKEANNDSLEKQQGPKKKDVVVVVNESQPKHQGSKKPMKTATCHNDSLEKQQGPKQTQKMPGLCAMSIDDFLKKNGVQVEEEDEELEIEGEEEGDIEGEGEIASEKEGTQKKRTRGPTRCLKVHARELDEERKDITLDEDGEAIGPNDEVVAELSSFIGNVAKSARYCPLIYTTFKGFSKKEKDAMWDFLNEKYIIPAEGKNAILARINDAWKRYKCAIRRKYFLKYPNLRERLKHRPKTIPKAHFKKLMIFWEIDTVQNICKKNAVNRTKQKYIHRMGTRTFARVKAQMRAKKNGSDVTQAEMFIETRTSRKGKEVDQDTQNVITKLHDSIQDSSKCAEETFKSIFGKEKAGRVRCSGRMVTPTSLKRKEEIADIKRQHLNETTRMAKKLDGLQGLVRGLLKQANPELDDEALDTIMENAMEVENDASTSMPVHDLDKENHPTFEEGELEVEDYE